VASAGGCSWGTLRQISFSYVGYGSVIGDFQILEIGNV